MNRLRTSAAFFGGQSKSRPALTAVLALTVLSSTSCRRRFSCQAIADRNKACADAFVAYAERQSSPAYEQAIDRMPPEKQLQARKRLAHRQQIAAKEIRQEVASPQFLEECRASWNDEKKFPKKQKQKLKECLRLDSCDAYVSCFMEAARMN